MTEDFDVLPDNILATMEKCGAGSRMGRSAHRRQETFAAAVQFRARKEPSMTKTALIAIFSLTLLGSAQAAGFDCSKFAKNDDGTWRAVEPLQIKGPHGRIDFVPDETYKEGQEKMGLDIAKLLNANCAKK